jgi:putative phage-type endonuclease
MIKQNTPEWLELRKNYIGASDAPPIMGVSPYQTSYQLWEEKLEIASPKEQTWAMKKGHEIEENARLELERQTNLFFLPEVKFHPSIPWMMASLDAIDVEARHIGEIKFANKEDHACAKKGNVPEKYFPQLQHQLEVSQVEMGYYLSFNEDYALVKVYRNDIYIKQLIEKEKAFWECVQEIIPPPLTDQDFIVQDSDLWLEAAKEWKQVQENLKVLEHREKNLRDTLIMMAQRKNSQGGGVRLTRCVRKGNVDYSLIPQIQELDLEPYRKKPTEYFKLNIA